MIELISYGAFFLTLALTYAIMCLGLNVQWGQTGLFNVGVAGFVGIGAYVSALLTTPPATDHLGGFDLPIVVGWIAAALAAGFASVLLGALTVFGTFVSDLVLRWIDPRIRPQVATCNFSPRWRQSMRKSKAALTM